MAGTVEVEREVLRGMYDYLNAAKKLNAVDDHIMKLYGSYLPLETCLSRWNPEVEMALDLPAAKLVDQPASA